MQPTLPLGSGSTSQAHLIYGPSNSSTNNRNYRNYNQKKYGPNTQQNSNNITMNQPHLQGDSSANGKYPETNKPYTSSNKVVRRSGQTGVSVDAKRSVAFRHAYKDFNSKTVN